MNHMEYYSDLGCNPAEAELGCPAACVRGSTGDHLPGKEREAGRHGAVPDTTAIGDNGCCAHPFPAFTIMRRVAGSSRGDIEIEPVGLTRLAAQRNRERVRAGCGG